MLSRSDRRNRFRRKASRSFRELVVPILAAVALAASGTIVACSDSPTTPVVPVAETARNVTRLGALTAGTVGAYHNAFLDFSFPKVRNALANGGGEQAACRAIAQAMREFVVAYRIAADPRGIGDDIAGGRCSRSPGRKPDHGGRFTLAGDGTTSAEFDATVEEMAYAVEASYSPSDLAALFDQKVAYARSNFPVEEADVIAAGAAVGLSSVDYWNANYETQFAELQAAIGVELYNRIPNDLTQSFREARSAMLRTPPDAPRLWRAAAARVGIADLKGAVHGGISGIRGGWPGVITGAAIEAGAKSAGALIGELFK